MPGEQQNAVLCCAVLCCALCVCVYCRCAAPRGTYTHLRLCYLYRWLCMQPPQSWPAGRLCLSCQRDTCPHAGFAPCQPAQRRRSLPTCTQAPLPACLCTLHALHSVLIHVCLRFGCLQARLLWEAPLHVQAGLWCSSCMPALSAFAGAAGVGVATVRAAGPVVQLPGAC